jgi:hypothetical protein
MFVLKKVSKLSGVFAVNPPVFAKPKDAAPVLPPSNPYGVSSPAITSPPPSYEPPRSSNNSSNSSFGSNSSSNSNYSSGSGIASKQETLRRQANEAALRECRAAAEELTTFMRTQARLEAGQQEIDASLAKMAEHKRQLQIAIDWTKKISSDLDEWFTAKANDAEKSVEVNVDEIVVPTSAVGAQLLQAVTANKAIEDALYVSNKKKWEFFF